MPETTVAGMLEVAVAGAVTWLGLFCDSVVTNTF